MRNETSNTRLACIGSGFMGEALIRGILAAGIYAPDEVCGSDISTARLAVLATLGVRTTQENAEAVAGAETVLLAVKPQVIGQVLEGLRPHLSSATLVLSIAAGVSLATLEGKLAPGTPVVRAMPN